MRGYLVIFLFLSGALLAGWNEQFDENTALLFPKLPQLNRGLYEMEHDFFLDLRKELVKDTQLKIRIKEAALADKFLCKEFAGLVLKKRSNDNIKECFVWELSHLLGTSECVVPSFPIQIADKLLIMQKKELFVIADKKTKAYPESFVAKVSLENYWRSQLTAYTLGLGDLLGRNIGISLKGKLRFFDMESSFKYCNVPKLTQKSFKPGFVMESFEWPQYRMPIGKDLLRVIQSFIYSLANFEEDVKAYMKYRPLDFDQEGLAYRLEKIRSFPLSRTSTFRDFYHFIFPRMGKGLDELTDLVSAILGYKVDDGAALFFVCSRKESYDLSDRQKDAINAWIDKYIR